MSIEQVVNVTITRQAQGVSRQGFGIPLIVGPTAAWAELTRTYASLEEVVADFATSDPEYLAARAVFSQSPKPRSVVIGRRTPDIAQVDSVNVVTVADATTYTVTINGVPFSIVSGVGATATTIRDQLIAAINAGAEPVTAAIVDADTLGLTADVAGDGFTKAVTANLSITAVTANYNVGNAILDIKEENDEWYMLVLTSHSTHDIMNAAATIETMRRMFSAASLDANCLVPASTTDPLYRLSALNYARTFCMYHEDPDAEYPEAAWDGRVLPDDPGSETWKFKTLAGVTASRLTTTEQNAVTGKNGNLYMGIGGVDITREGTVADGEFIDVIRFVDWLEARMEERIYQRLVDSEKIPYTDRGIAVIEAEVRAQLRDGIAVGGLSDDPAPTVTVPKVADVDPADRRARVFGDLTFSATLAGAIHEVLISGRVSV